MKQLATPILILIIPIQKKWFDDSFVKEMIRAVDKSEVLSSHAIESPVLGIIPTSKLSGGVKALILVYKKPELLIDCTACGENCAEWILKIAENQNTLINLNYFMDFPEPFELKIQNTLAGKGILRMYWKNIRRGQNWNITRKN